MGWRRHRRRGGADRRETLSAVASFAGSALLVLALVGVGGAWALERLGAAEAIADARRVTQVTAKGIVEPELTTAVVRGEPGALRRLDRIVRARVLDDRVIRVKIWNPDGRIVYSDEPRLIGRRFALDEDDREALQSGVVAAEISDLSGPENRFETNKGKLLEVYRAVRAQDGTPLLFEQYLRYGSVTDSAHTIWRLFAPLLAAALVALAALQLPLAWRLAGRVAAAGRDRERLLRQAVDASHAERRAIAGGLHDGVVQDLAGVSFQIAAAARHTRLPPEVRPLLAETATVHQNAIRQLRTLMLEIYPPRLHSHGLAAALPDLAAPLAARGVDIDVTVEGDDRLTADVEQLVFRVAREALRNVETHAGATRASVTVARKADAVELDVVDDGSGFDAEELAARAPNGHIGLSLLRELAASVKGSLDVASAPGAGTRVHLRVPTV